MEKARLYIFQREWANQHLDRNKRTVPAGHPPSLRRQIGAMRCVIAVFSVYSSNARQYQPDQRQQQSGSCRTMLGYVEMPIEWCAAWLHTLVLGSHTIVRNPLSGEYITNPIFRAHRGRRSPI